MTLKEPDVVDNSAIADFIRECGDAAARSAPTRRYPKRARPPKEVQFDLFPSPHESAAAQRFLERRADPSAKSQLKFKADDETKNITIVSAGHEKDSMAGRLVAMDTFATGYFDFSEAMLQQLMGIAVDKWGEFDAAKLDQAMAMIQGINPQNETEAMLALQMVTVHLATMKAGKAAATAEMREHQDWASGSLSKLARTFAMQADALRNLRLNGHQHHHVYHHRVDDTLPAAKTVRQPHGPSLRNQRNQTREPAQRTPLLREVEKIGKGLPRPRSARS